MTRIFDMEIITSNRSIKHIAIILCISFWGCAGTFERIPNEQFVGTWEMTGRKVYEGIQIKIDNDDGRLIGKVSKLNDNKYVQLFMQQDQVWIPVIERTSIYQFRLTENKIAKELFALYDLSPVQEYKVEFINKDSFALAAGDANPMNSRIIYKRVSD